MVRGEKCCSLYQIVMSKARGVVTCDGATKRVWQRRIDHKVVEVSDKDGALCVSLIKGDNHDRKRVSVVVGEISVPLTPVHGLVPPKRVGEIC